MAETTNTLERQRVINALVNAAQLRLEEVPGTDTVRSIDTVRYARADEVIADVVLALALQPDLVRLALESAVQQGALEVPVSLPVSEHPITFVRPGTL